MSLIVYSQREVDVRQEFEIQSLLDSDYIQSFFNSKSDQSARHWEKLRKSEDFKASLEVIFKDAMISKDEVTTAESAVVDLLESLWEDPASLNLELQLWAVSMIDCFVYTGTAASGIEKLKALKLILCAYLSWLSSSELPPRPDDAKEILEVAHEVYDSVGLTSTEERIIAVLDVLTECFTRGAPEQDQELLNALEAWHKLRELSQHQGSTRRAEAHSESDLPPGEPWYNECYQQIISRMSPRSQRFHAPSRQ